VSELVLGYGNFNLPLPFLDMLPLILLSLGWLLLEHWPGCAGAFSKRAFDGFGHPPCVGRSGFGKLQNTPHQKPLPA
jgi:hypothetical protein